MDDATKDARNKDLISCDWIAEALRNPRSRSRMTLELAHSKPDTHFQKLDFLDVFILHKENSN